MKNNPCILIADETDWIGSSLKELLTSGHAQHTIKTAANQQELLPLLKSERADVVLLAYSHFPQLLFTIAEIQQHYKNTRIVIYNCANEKWLLVQLIEAGIDGLLYRTANATEIQLAIATVCKGVKYITDEALHCVKGKEKYYVKQLINKNGVKINSKHLNIVQKLSKGFTYKEVADEVGLSEGTVRQYISQFYTWSDTNNLVELTIFLLNEGFITQ